MDKRDATETAVRSSADGSATTGSVGDHSSNPSTAVTLSVTPRRGRAVLLTVAMLAILAALTLVFLDGFSVLEFTAGEKSRDAQNNLLDNYNSYSGTITSAFSKPIEIFTTLAVQIVVLAFLAESMAKPSPSWKVGMLTLAAGAGVSYLVRNGINALNVQYRPHAIEPVIGAADLSIQSNATLAEANDPQVISSVTHPVLEQTPGNAAANTLLRNIVHTPPVRQPTQCVQNDTEILNDDYFGHVPEAFLQVGITQRDWQNRVLSQALTPAKRMHVVVNATKPSDSPTPQPSDFPMSASRAADLFLYSMIEMPRSFPWGQRGQFVDQNVRDDRFPVELVTGSEVASYTGSMADFTGMLPPETQHADEQTQRAWFLKQLAPAMSRQVKVSDSTSRADIQLEFTHLDLSPSLQFDALTIEAEIEPELLGYTLNEGGPRYTNISMTKSCGLWPGMCLFPKLPYSTSATEFDPPPQVRVFSPCVDSHGDERLSYTLNHTARTYFETLECTQRSNSSLYVLSVGKRLVADALTQNKTVNNATGVVTDPTMALATNLRKIYSFTIGRLAWTLTDLAETFHAECSSTTSSSKCMGLQFPLSSANGSTEPQQQLVVGADALPTNTLIRYIEFLYSTPRMITLARVAEPNPNDIKRGNVALAGDILLPHNIGKLTWDTSLTATPFACSPFVEDRLRLNLDNHYYGEYSLQPAYTAATLYLLQNAVVKDVLPLSHDRKTLAFTGNVHDVVVLLSIPMQNAWLTLAGCIVLVVGVVVAVGKPSSASEALAHITAPQAIARVMLDEKLFPPFLLDRRVVVAGSEPQELESLVVGSIALAPTFVSADPTRHSVANSSAA